MYIIGAANDLFFNKFMKNMYYIASPKLYNIETWRSPDYYKFIHEIILKELDFHADLRNTKNRPNYLGTPIVTVIISLLVQRVNN